jgi:hypothetical protein
MTAGNLLLNVFLDGPASLPPPEQYTYIFGGLAQMIDGVLLSPSLADLVVETMILHANTDFPYTLAADTSTAGLPFHFSDHDVPILLLNLEPEPPPTAVPTATIIPSPHPPVITPTSIPTAATTNDPSNTSLLTVLGLTAGTAILAATLFSLRHKFRK